MQLWIRTQDKERLLNVKIFELFFDDEIEKNDEFRMYAYINEDRQYLLGTYKTKKRALEVLNEIQNIVYMNKLFNDNANAFKSSLKELNMSKEEMNNLLKKISVFEMPEE